MGTRGISLFFLIFLYGIADVEGAIYRWVDEEGNLFFTDEKENVPQKYRGGIQEVIPGRPMRGTPSPSRDGQSVRTDPRPSVLYEQKTDTLGKGRKWWQNLAGKWERKKKDAEERIEVLKLEQRQLQFHQMMPKDKQLKEKVRIQKLIQTSIMRRDVAIRMLIEGLPNEAREAGAPIEWLSTH
jgi:hypothetical protein